ncbi:carbohydrate kinase family protein [Membranihabitans maritimus]|uniref:carbohydrate kinase family protein n=1 Tax=Membranihabitans maritimus TaxID=2904244 RepID=UPI001F15BAC3|nr:carbohydrate kinase family protein [Membranihabitans maritimus]
MKVLVIGELNIDIILDKFSAFPSIGKEVFADQMNITMGSSSAIFASNLSNLGNDVSFIGVIGKDYYGKMIIDTLHQHNVNTEWIRESSTHSTGLTVILNAYEDRANVTYPGSMKTLSKNNIDTNLFSHFSHLHISSYFLQPLLKAEIPHLFGKAKQWGLTTSFDMQWDPHETWEISLKEILPNVDVFLPNEIELVNATGADTVPEALEVIKPYSNITVVKQGNRGSKLFSNNTEYDLPAFLNEDVVDAIGAGDSFNAGFIHKYLQKMPLKVCQEFGSIIAAISTTQAGGTKALESKHEREKIAKEKFNKTI